MAEQHAKPLTFHWEADTQPKRQRSGQPMQENEGVTWWGDYRGDVALRICEETIQIEDLRRIGDFAFKSTDNKTKASSLSPQ
jgi:hypothetical protein